MALPKRSTITIEEYLQIDQTSTQVRYEYIDGHISMMAGGSPNHAKISANVIGSLGSLLADNSCSVYTSDARVRLSETRYVYPDVTVSCDERDQEQEDTLQYPCVVVEVLSPSTEARDRGLKLTYYQRCPSVQEYVLMDTQRQWVEVYRQEKNVFWSYHTFGPSDEVELASLGIRFAVATLYRKVSLPPAEEE